MSTGNGDGVVRIGRKGLRKFAFGEADPFEADVVACFQEWIGIDDGFRPPTEDTEGNRPIPTAEVPAYHQAAVAFVRGISNTNVTVAEALDFLARLREQYDELAVFFRPRSRPEPDSLDTSEEGSALQFLAEEETSPTSTN